jgi:hypothetical protein
MATKGSSPAGGGKTTMPKGDGLKAAWAAPSKSGGGPAGGGREPMPKGDGLKQAWSNQTAKPSVLSNVEAAKKRVR